MNTTVTVKANCPSTKKVEVQVVDGSNNQSTNEYLENGESVDFEMLNDGRIIVSEVNKS
jgi:hypothetical protein